MSEHDKRYLEKRHLFDNPANVKRVVRGLMLVCALLLGLDLVVHRHAIHPWEQMFGFYALYGLVACVLLVLLAKEMRLVVMRPESFYDKPENNPAETEPVEDGHD